VIGAAARRGKSAPPPLAIVVVLVLVLVLVLDIKRGLGMPCRNNRRARIDGTPNALGEAFLEDEDDYHWGLAGAS
jgi:hypothetical protein